MPWTSQQKTLTRSHDGGEHCDRTQPMMLDLNHIMHEATSLTYKSADICRVIVQRHSLPANLEDAEDVPYPVSLRFYVVLALLKQIDHQGTVFFLDTRDVYIQRDPFKVFSDGIMHFPSESSSYRISGPYTDNHSWLLGCFGK